ncbi:MAG TPA: helix-turn-helix domain-containing protein [Steroidobacteraceae bacterium]|nr:helix-turn-helix domain-containing protein [Steroidobacteraceae bacterium]
MAKPLRIIEARGNGLAARAAHQRERILDAAEKCFIVAGFHAAGMARVAETAGVSAGLIYRYFDSKASIVKAIVARHLENEGSRVIDQLASPEEMCDAMLDLFDRWRRGDDPKMNACLLLDLAAECSRDSKIARVVRDKDRMVEEHLARAVERIAEARGTRVGAAEARSRAIILQCLIEGLASRAVRDPTLQRRTLKSAMEKIVTVLLQG